MNNAACVTMGKHYTPNALMGREMTVSCCGAQIHEPSIYTINAMSAELMNHHPYVHVQLYMEYICLCNSCFSLKVQKGFGHFGLKYFILQEKKCDMILIN